MSALNTQVAGSHYREGGIQPVQFIEANNLPFLEGCVVKRVTRHARPTGKGRQDIEKAIHELQLLLELRYPVVADEHALPASLVAVPPAELRKKWAPGQQWQFFGSHGWENIDHEPMWDLTNVQYRRHPECRAS